MPPKTRSSSSKTKVVAQKDVPVKQQKKSKTTSENNISFDSLHLEKNKREGPEVILISDEEIEPSKPDQVENESGSDSDSSSSSSAEDSDDDYEKELSRNGVLKNSVVVISSEDEEQAENVLRDIEKKLDREKRKRSVRRKEKQLLEGHISDDDDIDCLFESADIPKVRRRRLYRRRMIRTTDTSKRRRIKRPDMDMADDYTCDTLVDFGSTSNTITKDMEWEDPELDGRAVRRLFRELESDDEVSEQSEEDEVEIVSHNLSVYQSRNSKERVAQTIELEVAPFSEKLACYNSIKAVHGASRSTIQNHHPGFLVKQDVKLPEELLWERPFTALLYTSAQFDDHEKCNGFLNNFYAKKNEETETKLLGEIKQRVYEKSLESQFNNMFNHENITDQLPFMNDNPNDFFTDNYEIDDFLGDDDYSCHHY